ncbi:hypothetical protein [Rhodococcus spongiicola]|uniref:Uncharacterized protein n=1 Tax=Rhodococcus spongiicola TaxID=2487352 RepID=A0A3S3CS96_9NOCA|nr:hypothetical protein [Rhodococcus spongiicola]RVW04423.1 hypothetical protein EF834_04890 [Rhodococcus spongiicola]
MTAMLDKEKLFTELGNEKARETASHIGFLRSLRQLSEAGVPQTVLAARVGVSQPAISDMLRRARLNAPDVRPGTHGGTPYEIAARYAAGELDRETMIRELVEWEYEPPPEPNPLADIDTYKPPRRGGFNNQVGRAFDDKFLTDEEYNAVLDGLAGRSA